MLEVAPVRLDGARRATRREEGEEAFDGRIHVSLLRCAAGLVLRRPFAFRLFAAVRLLAIKPGTAWSIMTLLFVSTLAIPFAIGLRRGWRAGFFAVLVWATLGFAIFYSSGDLGVGDALGVALVVFAAPWLMALAGGVTVRRKRLSG